MQLYFCSLLCDCLYLICQSELDTNWQEVGWRMLHNKLKQIFHRWGKCIVNGGDYVEK